MRIKVIGENDCARALRGLLRKAGFAVSEFLPAALVREMPSGGYVIYIEEAEDVRPDSCNPERPVRRSGSGSGSGQIYFDSVDCELERNILRHVTPLSTRPVVVDRPGGVVHSDREIRILVPADEREQQAVEFGVLRGLLDTVHGTPQGGAAGKAPVPWWRRLFFRGGGK